MPEKTLVYTIALNGYDERWEHCLQSHRKYAERYRDYEYIAVTEAPKGTSLTDSVWLKISLMVKALEAGYAWVLWVDADCEIMPRCPRIQSLEKEGKSLYLAKGHSGRVNAGMMIVKNTLDTLCFYQLILENMEQKIPSKYRVLYENGHVIYYSLDKEYLDVIDQKWNNCIDPELNDYIRHYTGPMGNTFGRDIHLKADPPSFVKRVLKKIGYKKATQLKDSLRRVTEKVSEIYPQFKELA